MSFVGVSSFQSGSSATTTGHMTLPGGITVADLMIAVMGLEGVTPGSGPWAEYDPNGAHPDGEGDLRPAGWVRLSYEEPSASGNGIEVWTAFFGAGTFSHFKFAASRSFAAQIAVYRGHYVPASPSTTNPVDAGTIRAVTKAQVTGHNPAGPSVYAYAGEEIVTLAADQLVAPGFTAPPGFTGRFDGARGGAYGNVEIAVADMIAAITGDTGPLAWAATAASGATKGTTMTLGIRPAPLPAGSPGSAPLNFRFQPA